jgi:hypothetical protein
MPALLTLNGKTYEAALTPFSVELMEEMTDKGLPSILFGVGVAKVSDTIAFTLAVIHNSLPQEIKLLSNSERKLWLWEESKILDGNADAVANFENMRALYRALTARDTPTADDSPIEDAAKNAQTPPANGGPSSASSPTATSKSATRTASGQ